MIKNFLKNIKQRINHHKNTICDPKPKLLILLYHRVLGEAKFNPLKTVISLKTFIKQIEILARRFAIISLSNAISQCKSGFTRTNVQIVLTFDDGYWDNYEIVFPILNKKGIPATFFLITDYLDGKDYPWDTEIMDVLSSVPSIKKIEIDNETLGQRPMESRLSFAFRVFDRMKSISLQKRQGALATLKNQAGINFGYLGKDRSITWEQARKMSQGGMEIGAHSLSHRSLARIPFPDAEEEIKKSKEIIERKIERPCYHFAFPYGNKYDYNLSLVNCVKETGFMTCMLSVHGYNHLMEDNFCFKRIVMEQRNNIDCLLG